MPALHQRITSLFNIDIPIVQAGMVWASGWKLASAVSNAGALGVIGSGSMKPDILQHHILQCKAATSKPFGVNIPLLYSGVNEQIDIIIKEKIPIVFTSAGNPASFTRMLKDNGIIVIHVVSSRRFAVKAQSAGCDAIVAEGFEAGGHNGREETTSFVLIPSIRKAVDIPLIAAGGIATGRQMAAAIILGAEGIQVGSRFVASDEASSHAAFKEAIVNANEGDTELVMKQVTPVRLLKNKFHKLVKEAEQKGASTADMLELLGKGRARKGMFEGDMDEGELEIGQVAALIDNIMPASEIVAEIWQDYNNIVSSTLK